MPLLMFFPSLSTVCQMGVCAWALAALILVQTTKAESLDVALNLIVNGTWARVEGQLPATPTVDPIGSVRDLVSDPNYQNGSTLVVVFGFFVLVQFVQGIAWCTMSGATYYWYFFRKTDDPDEKTRVPIARSLMRTVFYHSGSVAFAAFVIAFCDTLRAVAAYLEKQMGPTNNFMVKLAFKVLNCVLWCVRKTVKFVSYYGLVFVACQGHNFCLACYRTFFFFLQNPGQVSINALVVKLLRVVAWFSMPLACAITFYYILDGELSSTSNAVYPAGIIYLLALIMTTSCMTVFECTITTIFVCCFQDKAEFGGKHMSKQLAKAFGIDQSDGGKESADDDKKADADKDTVKQTL